MKATDLMIGDWVNYQPGDTPQYMKVGMVSGYDIQLDLYREGGTEVAAQVWFDEENYIRPIPLTPEILEKNGWKHKYYGIYRQTIGETITIDIFPEGCSVEDERGSQCLYRLRYHLPVLKFVHELQHALRLCGIEKEIIL